MFCYTLTAANLSFWLFVALSTFSFVFTNSKVSSAELRSDCDIMF